MFTFMRMREPQLSKTRRLYEAHERERERRRAVNVKREEVRAQKARDTLLAFVTARQEALWRDVLIEYRNELNERT